MSLTSRAEPIIPQLGPYYDQGRDLAWLLVRLTAGGFLLIHGLQKLFNQTLTVWAANSLARRGIEPAVPLAYLCGSWKRSARSASCSACSPGSLLR